MKDYLKNRLQESSTYRGLVWLVFGAIGTYKLVNNQPIDDLMVLSAAVAGGLGLTSDDKPK